MFDGQKLQFAVNYLNGKKTYRGLLLEKSMDNIYIYIYAAQGKVGSFPVLFETCWRHVVSVRVPIAVLEINILF